MHCVLLIGIIVLLELLWNIREDQDQEVEEAMVEEVATVEAGVDIDHSIEETDRMPNIISCYFIN